jgi:hypothetical protein
MTPSKYLLGKIVVDNKKIKEKPRNLGVVPTSHFYIALFSNMKIICQILLGVG